MVVIFKDWQDRQPDCKSVLCGFEVCSLLFLHTIRKMVYTLVELLRIVKGHHMYDCSLIGFAFPKLKVKRYVAKITVTYARKERAFVYSQKVEVIKNEVLQAVKFNMETLKKFEQQQLNENAYWHVITYNPQQLSEYRSAAIQLKCNYGTLIEANINDTVYCIKRPLYKSSFKVL